MRIAFVNQPWAAVVPGEPGDSLSIWIDEVGRRLSRSHEVIAYSRQMGTQGRVERHDGVEHRRVPVTVGRFIRPLRLLDRLEVLDPRRPVFASTLYYPDFGLLAARDIGRRRCDVVHVMNFSQFAPMVRRASPDAAVVLHMHCEWLSSLDRRMIERRLGAVDLVVTCSEYCTDLVRRAFPQFASRCHTVYNGVDVDRFVPAPDRGEATGSRPRRIVFVGVVSPHKGVHVLLEAFREVHARHPDAELHIVGGDVVVSKAMTWSADDDFATRALAPYYEMDYPAHLRSLLPPAVARQVIFDRHVPYSRIHEHYQAADVLVAPSVWQEPFGMPVAEAMAAGVPVVCTRSGGMPEIVEDGTTGYVVERGDAGALAAAILRLLEDEARRRTMGRAARQRVLERFTWDAVSESLLACYARIEPRSGPRRAADGV